MPTSVRVSLVLLLGLLACTTDETEDSGLPAGPDLTEALSSSQVRAGIITDSRALFGGISAEGAPGDIKLYNDRVQFVIEAVGDSSYYVDYGGNLIDADLIRAAGVPGRDMLDELTPMSSFGRVCDASSVEVIADGSDGKAHVRVSGPAAAMRLVTSALENPDTVPWYDLTMVTDYVLRPGEWSVEVTTTLTNHDTRDFQAAIGLFGIYAQEIAEGWHPRTGFADSDGEAVAMEAMVGAHNEAVLALMAGTGELQPSAIGELISGIAAGATAFDEPRSVAAGAALSWVARVGVAPDLATLEAERLLREGATPAELAGSVQSGGVGLAGARVHGLDAAGAPVTLAVTDATGSFSMPGNGITQLVASGRGTAITSDIPAGHGNVSPYDRGPDGVLATLTNGATPIPFAAGYGFGEAVPAGSTTLSLLAPGTLAVTVADGGPASILVDFAAGDTVTADNRLVPSRPDGRAALGFVRDGAMDIPLEPGTYRVTVHRGIRYEVDVQEVTVTSGEVTALNAVLTPAYTLDGILTIDPHQHASPSGDGNIAIEDRLVVAAANGIEVHVGTDHDHIVDYRPALEALGLQAWLHSIVAIEVSPVLRGHFNAYPATRDGRPNGGAPRWWQRIQSTEDLFAWIRESVGTEGIIQANHPVSGSGLFSAADYSPGRGTIGSADHWGEDFDAMELLNSGQYDTYFPYYVDLAARGKLITPVGVSDSHGFTAGSPGLNLTFIQTGTTLSDFTPEVLRSAMALRATVVSYGPYIEATSAGKWAPGQTVAPGTLDVRVLAPSWIPVQYVELWKNGSAIDRVACSGEAPVWCTTSWTIPDDTDASWVVVAGSTDAPMVVVWPGALAWGATSAIQSDVDGNGWTPPLPPLVSL